MKIFSAFILLVFFTHFSYGQTDSSGYAYVRVWDCAKSISAGNLFMDQQILITYETGETERIDLLPFNEKNAPENMKTLTAALNAMRKKGYALVAHSSTGDQGALISDYIFLKQ